MAYTPFEFSVPAEYASSFTAGEKVISVASPLAGATARTGYSMSRWLYLEAGTYTVKTVGHTAVTWILGSVKEIGGERIPERQMLFTTVGSQGVVTREFVVHKSGVKKIDLMLKHMGTTTGQCYVIFSITRSGTPVYSSSVDGWVCQVGGDGIAPNLMPAQPDARLSMPVFTLQPNWKDGILERIEYLTGVLTSTTDAEQRRMMRLHPRRSFEASFLRENEQRARLDSFIAGHGHTEFLVPLWHEQLRLPYGEPVQDVVVTFDGYNHLSNGQHNSDGEFISNGFDLLYDLLSDGDTVSDGVEISDGYKD